MKPSLRAMVDTVEAESEYAGSVFDRTVRIQRDSTEIACYEGKSHVTNEDVGTEVDLILLAQQSHGRPVSEETDKGILQPESSSSEQSKWHTTLIGEVLCADYNKGGDQNSNNGYFLLDVGMGTILASPSEKLQERFGAGDVENGSSVEIEAGRIDIIGRNDG